MVMFDVVEAILLRLPVKDLLRCKSVCESWYSLISSPSFVKTHVKFISNKEEYNRRKIAKFTAYKELAEAESESEYQIPEEWESYDCWVLEGSSNGLILLLGARLCVTNPVTREFRELQQPPERLPGENRCFGFGYDSSTDDYKVVMAICQKGKSLARILSLKSNIWNNFGQINYKFDDGWLQKPGILFNGALHWFWFDANDKASLVSFDLAKEEFREIPQPDDTRYVWNLGCSLGIMEGRLCIFPFFDDDNEDFPSCGTWVMKNYNVKPSWELLSKDCEMNDHAIHYILNNDTSQSMIMPTYPCDENIQLSRSKEDIASPIFVQTLVSPFVINNGGPSHVKNNKSTAANAGNVKEKREIREVYRVEDKEEEIDFYRLLSGSRRGAEIRTSQGINILIGRAF